MGLAEVPMAATARVIRQAEILTILADWGFEKEVERK